MKNKNISNFFKTLLKQNKCLCGICLLLMLLSTLLSIILPKILQYIIDDLVIKKELELLLRISVAYIGICIVNMAISIGKERLIVGLKKKVVVKYKLAILRKVCTFSGKEISDAKTGEILNLLEGDTSLLEDCGIDIIFDTIGNFLKAMLAFGILLSLQADMFIFVLILECIIIWSQLKFTKIITNQIGELREKSGKIYSLEQEFLTNIFLMILYKAKQYFFKGYCENEKLFFKKAAYVDILYCLNIEIGTLLSGIIMIFIYAYGGYKITIGKMTIGALIAFSQYIGMFISPCLSLFKSNAAIQKLKVAIDRIYKFLDSQIEIKQINSGLRLTSPVKEISFRDVSFKYEKKEVIEHLNFSLERGNVYAFVGESGCGKSTIVNLLYRFWDVVEGEILIDGINIKKYNLKSLRKNITVSTQNVYMLDDEVKNNILLGRKISTEEYMEICKDVGIEEIANCLSSGHQTMVGENAIRLSGGQKQRIALARTLINAKDVIIFDEATSALDNITQGRIVENMRNYYRDRIVIIIAHRLSTIRDVDKIFVMHDGTIKDSGTHQELMEEKGYYYQLVTEHEPF